MKKVIGVFLLTCGILSLPSLLYKLTQARDIYEVIGMLIGQSLIFFLAYLCFKSNKKATKDISKVEENNEKGKSIAVNTNTSENASIQTPTDIEINSLLGKHVDDVVLPTQNVNDNNEPSEITNNLVKDPSTNIDLRNSQNEGKVDSTNSFTDNAQPKSEITHYPQIDFHHISWEKIMWLIFSYQKSELKEKCNPSNFMMPYDHDKIELANSIIIKLNSAENLEGIKKIMPYVDNLGVKLSTNQVYDYLCTICSPTNFIGSESEFKVANDLYKKVLDSKDDIERLELLLDEAKNSIKLDSQEAATIKTNQQSFRKFNIIIWVLLAVWIGINIVLWASNGVLYNATEYFFPFQTSNLAKFDYTEFFVYGIGCPLGIFLIYKFFSFVYKE